MDGYQSRDFIDWMITLRESKGLSQTDLADTMTFGRSMVNRVESRERPASADYVIAFAVAMGIPVAEALYRAGVIPEYAVNTAELGTPQDLKVVLELDRLLSLIPVELDRAKTMNTVRAVIKAAIQNFRETQEKAEIEADRRELMALFDQLTEEEQNTLLWAARSQNTKGKGAKGNEAKGSQDVVRGRPQKAR